MAKRAARRGGMRRAGAILGGAALAVALAVAGWVAVRTPREVSRFPFPCLGMEGLAQHIHPLLRIVIDRKPVTIPAGVGILDPVYSGSVVVGGSCYEPLHTHDASGIIHIESPYPAARYTLGDFFAVWRATYGTVDIGGKRWPVVYEPGNLLGHKAGASRALMLIVDGKPSSAGPGLVLNDLDYCSAAIGRLPPCRPTATGDPFPPLVAALHGTGHTIVLDYETIASPGPVPAAR